MTDSPTPPEAEVFTTPALDAMMGKLAASEGDTSTISDDEFWAALSDAFLALGASMNEAGSLYSIAGGILEQLQRRRSDSEAS